MTRAGIALAGAAGEIIIGPGCFDNYKTLERFHYLPRRPSTVADVVAAWHLCRGQRRCVAAGVLSWPTACSFMRQRVFEMAGWSYGRRLKFVNAQVRTISRVIVHPTFRGIGLSGDVIRLLIVRCPTRYVEASALMGRAHPLFERAGMARHEPEDAQRAIYYLIDKQAATKALMERAEDRECIARRISDFVAA